MVRGYAEHYGLSISDEALAWALGRGARSGRVAYQYIQDVAGRLGVRIEP
jgi:predicted AAA+ superfamily ATPase